MTDFPKYDTKLSNKVIETWVGHKIQDPMTFRDQRHRSPSTGTLSSEVKIPWASNWVSDKDAFLDMYRTKL